MPSLVSAPGGPQTHRPRRRWLRRLLVGAALALALVWLTPIVIANTPLRTWLARQALSDMRGTVDVGRASLGWLSRPVLEDVVVRDADGQTVLEAARIEASRTLLSLVLDSSELGTFRVVRPHLRVMCAGEQTSLEEVFAHWLGSADAGAEPTAAGAGVTLEVIEGTVTINDRDAGRQWLIHPLGCSVTIPRDPAAATHAVLEASLSPGATQGHPGTGGTASLSLTSQGARLEGKLRLERFPLAVVGPVLRRLQPGAHVEGLLGGDVHCSLEQRRDEPPTLRVEGNLEGDGLKLAGPWLGKDQLVLQKLELAGKVSSQGARASAEGLRLACDVGSVSAQGSVDLSGDPIEELLRPGQAVEVEVDLGRLARMLPGTLRLQEGAEVTSGRIRLAASSREGPEGAIWVLKGQAGELRWRRQGQEHAWNEPVAVDLSVRRRAGRLPVVERGQLDAGFVKVTASGDDAQIVLDASFDLERLTRQAAQLVDLGGWSPGGEGSARLTLTQTEAGKLQVAGEARLSRLRVPARNGRTWHEEQLTLQVGLAGSLDDEGTVKIETGQARALLGADEASLRLLGPINDLPSGNIGATAVVVRGDLKRWHDRVKPWTTGTDTWQASGHGEVAGTVSLDAEKMTLAGGDATLGGVRFRGLGLSVDEPVVRLKTAGQLRLATAALELGATEVAATDLQLRLAGLKVGSGARGQLELSGQGVVQGDVGRLQRWLQDPDPAPGDALTGRCQGPVELFPAEGLVGVRLDLALEHLAQGPPQAPSWREPRSRVQAACRYDLDADRLLIDRVRVETSLASAEAQGRLERATTAMEVLLDGRLEYDMKQLEPWLRPYLGQDCQVAGKGHRPFHLEGALAPPGNAGMLHALKGSVAMHWDAARAFGCELGAAELRADLGDGVLRLHPVQTTISRGQLRAGASLRLDPAPREAYLDQGVQVDGLHLTPAICGSALGYALPALANVLEAEGTLSLVLERGRIPLASPTLAELQGKIRIHSARVGSSPVIREVCSLLNVTPAVSLTQESTITFQMSQGRVHHQNLEMIISGATVRTSGWVGLDGSLGLVADLPMPAGWLGNSPLRETLARQRLQIPLRGTLSNPRLDEKAVRDAMARTAQQVGQDVLRQQADQQLKKAEDEIKDRLQDIFRRRK